MLSSIVPIKGQTLTPASQDVDMSATIITPPTVKLTIFGYGPAGIPVSLTGKNVLEITTSNESGYFEFNNVPLPDLTETLKFYPELCLQGYYKEVSTQPVCLPKIPTGQEEYKIGPVLLSPIIVIENQEALVKSQIKAVGKAIPNSPIQAYLAKESRENILNIIKNIRLIQKVSAYYLPKYETKSDENGNFEFNLPTDSQAKWRIFVSYTFHDQNSPKSNTLSYQVKSPILELIKKFLQYLIKFILSEPLISLIIVEILFLIVLIYLTTKKDRHPKTKKKEKITQK